MKILLDQGTPAPLRQHLAGHMIDTAYERGWSNLVNGDLLNAMEQDGYQVLITTDQNLRYSQDLSRRRLAVIVLLSTSWPHIRMRVDEIRVSLEKIAAGDYREISI